ncbi:hypothetical protein [Nocardiopsis dassonvillei]|uniref:hypothetical protein n=1 Tax=Nocardiopsis dassonvillei TaxID=2014 RepID=UPI003411401B
MDFELSLLEEVSCKTPSGCWNTAWEVIISWSGSPVSAFLISILALIFSAIAALLAAIQIFRDKSNIRLRMSVLERSYADAHKENVDSLKVELILQNSGKTKRLIRSCRVIATGNPQDDSCAEPLEVSVLKVRYNRTFIEGNSVEYAEYIVSLPKLKSISSWSTIFAEASLEPGGVVNSNISKVHVPFFVTLFNRIDRWTKED